ncbi:MAG TPA: CoA-binding protein [Chitinophagales bacterium]|nr:CoA-binding protein [Chitinophagales bacterium]
MENKKTVVLGASPKPERYAYKAIKQLTKHGHDVVAIGNRAAMVDAVAIQTSQPEENNVDTVTLYLNPMRQKEYYDYILNLKPKRIIFNPGTENDELENLAKSNGIETIEACTLVLLSINQY